MQEPAPEQYNPPRTWLRESWRFGLALLISGLLWLTVAEVQWDQARFLFWLDLAAGMTAFGLVAFRRRWPLTVALLTTALGAFSATAAGPGTLAAVSLATRRQLGRIVLVGVVSVVAGQLFPEISPQPQGSVWWVTLAVGIAFTIAVLSFGMYVGSRRELLWTLRQRAEQAEAQQELRAEQARVHERTRIAREMHDVLAHRISLVAMHAGALAYRTDLTPEEVQSTAELIQAKAHEALTDLRQVLGVLREADPDSWARPQPTFSDLRALIEEAEQSGMHVKYVDAVLDAREMPEQVGRTTYRIVQEGLTNARKHAPGAAVLVSVGGSPDEGVDINVRNPARAGDATVTPGAGLGLVGLAERTMLAGGRLESRRWNGSFELHGWLPWTT